MSADNEGPVLDLSKFHTRRDLGAVTVYTTWYGATLAESEPCLVLIKAYGRPQVPCVIRLSDAWKWDEHTGDPRHCATMTALFARGLGWADDRRNAAKLLLLIQSCLGDLLTTPPKPVSEIRDVAEATITYSSGKTKTVELREEV